MSAAFAGAVTPSQSINRNLDAGRCLYGRHHVLFVWSSCGTDRTKPSEAQRRTRRPKTPELSPKRLRWDGKEGVNGSSPLEGFANSLVINSF